MDFSSRHCSVSEAEASETLQCSDDRSSIGALVSSSIGESSSYESSFSSQLDKLTIQDRFDKLEDTALLDDKVSPTRQTQSLSCRVKTHRDFASERRRYIQSKRLVDWTIPETSEIKKQRTWKSCSHLEYCNWSLYHGDVKSVKLDLRASTTKLDKTSYVVKDNMDESINNNDVFVDNCEEEVPEIPRHQNGYIQRMLNGMVKQLFRRQIKVRIFS